MTQPTLFETRTVDFQTHHKGLRGKMIECIHRFYLKRGRLPILAERRCKGTDNDRETLLAENMEVLSKWRLNSQRATYSWGVRQIQKAVK